MLGLGVGSRLGAAVSRRVTAGRALLLFAACELGIAVYGAASCPLLYDFLYARHGWLYAEPLRGGLMHFATLAVPTVLMGMSLPLLTRAVVERAETAGGTIAFLYGINVLGAAAGALATPWVFFRHHGVRPAVWAAAIPPTATTPATITPTRLFRTAPLLLALPGLGSRRLPGSSLSEVIGPPLARPVPRASRPRTRPAPRRRRGPSGSV